jgi:hypothetical protein
MIPSRRGARGAVEQQPWPDGRQRVPLGDRGGWRRDERAVAGRRGAQEEEHRGCREQVQAAREPNGALEP